MAPTADDARPHSANIEAHSARLAGKKYMLGIFAIKSLLDACDANMKNLSCIVSLSVSRLLLLHPNAWANRHELMFLSNNAPVGRVYYESSNSAALKTIEE